MTLRWQVQPTFVVVQVPVVGFVPVLCRSICGSAGCDSPVFSGTSAANVEAGKLRQVRTSHRSGGSRATLDKAWPSRDRSDRRNDES
jgi:hypothetical protein